MGNPNNCDACKFRSIGRGEGWCYMFAEEPDEFCYQHSEYKQERMKDGLITMQQVEIAELKRENEEYVDSVKSVLEIIYGIGGPLNDNKKRYTKEQMADFIKIKTALGV